MNTQLASAPARQEHPPQPGSDPAPTSDNRTVRRVGLLDRAALHLGVALVTWSRRPGRVSRSMRVHLTLDDAGRRELADARREQEELRDQFLALHLFR